MKPWNNAKMVVALAIVAWGCGMAESAIFQPKPPDGINEVSASDDSKKLDAELTAFVRGKYAIASAHYYHASSDAPWIAISKSVQNQMAAKSIQKMMFPWYEPGLDFIEIYPQGKNGAAFALAMPKNADFDGDKLIGFYVLSTPAKE